MGLYSFRFPHEFEAKDYAKLVPNKTRFIVLNLTAIGDSSNTDKYSIQAVSTATVKINCFVSNYSRCPWTDKTEHKYWEVPTPLAGTPAGLWLPCTSIASFQVSKGQNYNSTGDWKDPYQFLMFAITADSLPLTSPTPPIPFEEDTDLDVKEMIDPETGLKILKVKKDLTPPRLESDVYYNEALEIEESVRDSFTEVAFSFCICFL